jgi:hypothetical protein
MDRGGVKWIGDQFDRIEAQCAERSTRWLIAPRRPSRAGGGG